ncbi:uncharacterized protein [Parasteatoda tepidariorum]|uniref:uncharacterized protein n=1 Tax=Parasteatoda tepidariorum TaxID=114398 RepID=UPI001C723B31|nr:uncharacterized protein LOC122273782 [Parasteatoda tepidariorum]
MNHFIIPAFKMEHFSMLNRILVGQQNIEAMLTDVKRQTGAPSREPLPEGAPQLPLKTEAEIFGLEKMNRSSLMSHLALIGGKDVEKATRNLMGRIFSKDVAPLLNWAGRGGKMAFSTLLIKDVVVG